MNNQDAVTHWVDSNRLETVICLEKVLNACYQTLAGMIHNQTIRLGCQRFEQQAQFRQEELKKMFLLSQESEIIIENKFYEYLVMLKPPYLFLSTVINLAINLTEYKINIYKYFFLKDRQNRNLLNKFIEDSEEELLFLRRERNYHLDKSMDPHLKGSLN